jgi:hypothetical protein
MHHCCPNFTDLTTKQAWRDRRLLVAVPSRLHNLGSKALDVFAGDEDATTMPRVRSIELGEVPTSRVWALFFEGNNDYGATAGFNAGLAGEEGDENKSKAWLRGWAEAQE